jgi:hypothetical protein
MPWAAKRLGMLPMKMSRDRRSKAEFVHDYRTLADVSTRKSLDLLQEHSHLQKVPAIEDWAYEVADIAQRQHERRAVLVQPSSEGRDVNWVVEFDQVDQVLCIKEYSHGPIVAPP